MNKSMMIGDVVPDFEAETTMGKIKFSEWIKGSWAVFFSHPADFTPVCTTELGMVAKLKSKWEQRNVKVIALSVDSLEDHKKWVKDIEETQKVKMYYPIIADANREIAKRYGMIHPNAPGSKQGSVTVRATFIIDDQMKLRAILTYPPTTGRNFNEIIRVLDSLQMTDKHDVATPADWQPGHKVVLLPSVSDEEAKSKFGDKVEMQRPYLRMVDDPSAA